MDQFNLTIIGAGVVGSALGYELSKTLDGILVLDRNKLDRKTKRVLGENQSSRNSGVMHAGIYYDPAVKPLKAGLCVQGNELLYQFCQEHHVPHRRTGKLVVAVQEYELEYLENTQRIADENGVLGVEWINQPQMGEFGLNDTRFTRNVHALAALHVPTSGIIDSTSLVNKLRYVSQKTERVHFQYDSLVESIESDESGFELTIREAGEKFTFRTKKLINAAGLYADDIARMVNPENTYVIIPVRGEAAKFYRRENDNLHALGMNIYPAPYVHDIQGNKILCSLQESKELSYRGKGRWTVGLHLTPTLGGYEKDNDRQFPLGKEITICPAKNKNFGKDDYVSDPRPMSYYHQQSAGFLHGLQEDELHPHQIGIMAVGKRSPQSVAQDWIMERDTKYPHCIHLMGIDSPGLTASLAIAKYVIKNFI